MATIAIRDMLDYDLAGMTGEIATVLGIKLYELPDAQRSALGKIGYKYAGRAVQIVKDHLPPVSLATAGGKSKSPRKAAAARKNGRKGGRPAKLARQQSSRS